MPSWDKILAEITEFDTQPAPVDFIRRKYLSSLHELTSRNVIVYYSGWLQKGHLPLEFHLTDGDKNGLWQRSIKWIALKA